MGNAKSRNLESVFFFILFKRTEVFHMLSHLRLNFLSVRWKWSFLPHEVILRIRFYYAMSRTVDSQHNTIYCNAIYTKATSTHFSMYKVTASHGEQLKFSAWYSLCLDTQDRTEQTLPGSALGQSYRV